MSVLHPYLSTKEEGTVVGDVMASVRVANGDENSGSAVFDESVLCLEMEEVGWDAEMDCARWTRLTGLFCDVE